MGKKMQVSLALKGKLSSHGLTAMDDDDDVLTALARELVAIGERAAAVWKSLQRSNAFASAPAPPQAVPACLPESDMVREGQRVTHQQPVTIAEQLTSLFDK